MTTLFDLPAHASDDWLNAEYNNRALVPEHGAIFERWAQASVQARAAAPGALIDVRYGNGELETLDVFPARQGRHGAPAPVLFFIHGGYWRSLDKSDHAFIAPAFTARGACVVSINYALCPAVTIPQIVMQTVRALAWTWRHIGAHGGDPSRITVAGHSAGGHLATQLLACEWPRVAPDLPADLIRNALSISGLYDLEPVRRTPFVQPSLNITPAHVAQASPARLPAPPVREGRGTLAAVAGALESSEFRRHNRLIQQAWGRDVVPVCEELPGLNHFTVVDALAQPGHRLHTIARRLLGV